MKHLTYIRLYTQKQNGHMACVDVVDKLPTRPLFNCILPSIYSIDSNIQVRWSRKENLPKQRRCDIASLPEIRLLFLDGVHEL